MLALIFPDTALRWHNLSMPPEAQKEFLIAAAVAAKSANHIFPAMAACEAALESSWGTSKLAVEANNLFGSKQQAHPIYAGIHLPTREFLNHVWVTVEAAWVKYPDWQTCFRERMNTLKRLSGSYAHYAAALKAAMPEVYAQEVSRSWSTDPERAEKCIEIYHAHLDILQAALK